MRSSADEGKIHIKNNSKPRKQVIKDMTLDEQWVNKVSICEEGRAHENDLLHHYMFGLLATGAAFVAGIFAIISIDGIYNANGVILGWLSILATLLWMLAFIKKARLVDNWEYQLAILYASIGLSDIERHYIDGKRRKELRNKVDKFVDKIKNSIDNKRKLRLFRPAFKVVTTMIFSPMYVFVDFRDIHFARWVIYLIFCIVIILSILAILLC